MKIKRRFPGVGKNIFVLSAAAGSLTFAELKGGNCFFFGFSRSKPDDPLPMQQRGYDAVRQVSARLESAGFETHLLQSPAPTAEEQIIKTPTASCETVRRRLQAWRESLHADDTIIIYSHTHGLKTRADRTGGLLLGRSQPGEPLILSWADYAEELLRLPAKTVVVLTMGCHSGELTDWLNSDEHAKSLWQERKENGRNFLVLTSQNAQSLSNPRRIEGRIINPFTNAVLKALEGAADGYRSDGPPGQPDGKITLGELAGFILDETVKFKSAADPDNDPDPQITGSFDPTVEMVQFDLGYPPSPPFALSLNRK